MTPVPFGSPGWFDLAAPGWLHALWLAPIAFGLFAWSFFRRRRALRLLADPGLLPGLAGSASRAARWLKAALTALAIAAAALALARPRWDPVEQPVVRRGRDVAFVVDVSRSMLARDLAPDRLERAKLWIGDLVSELEGDRVALVAFAGAPVIRSPLTVDHGFVRLQLEELSPEIAPYGGTNIGDAIRKTLRQVFEVDPADPKPEQGRYRDIVLITDGADQDSLPIEAARLAAAAGVRIIAIGIGSPAGAPIPAGDGEIVRYGGEQVMAALDAETLTQIAAATPGGVFLNVGTGRIELDRVYRDLIDAAEQRESEAGVTLVYKERYVWFVWAAVALLCAEALIGDRRRTWSTA